MTAAARPAKSARHVAKIKAMRKVKGAIRWQEHAREKRQKLVKERSDDKRAFNEVRKWRQENVVKPIKEAKKNIKEDYEMGPLRPNRAVGPGADKYGILGIESMRRPAIAVDTWRRKNEAREAKGFEPEYPLVVDDKKYFPIAADDRVIVMKGREQGKIGVIAEVLPDSHEVVIKDINQVRGFVSSALLI
jgi:large subunit ribosomal protein L24